MLGGCQSLHVVVVLFRSPGLCVGSGVVEGGCKSVIVQRFKRSGMHWGTTGANVIIAPCAAPC